MKETQTKICPQCHQEKSASGFSKDKRTKTGLCCWCKSCTSAYRAKKRGDWYKEQMKRFEAAGGKSCPKCGQFKPISDFYTNSWSGLSAYCKTCDKTSKLIINQTDPALHRAKKLAYYHSKREQITARRRARYAINADRLSITNRLRYAEDPQFAEKCRRAVRAYRASNPEKVRETNRRYWESRDEKGYQREMHRKHRANRIESRRQAYLRNADRVKAQTREWRISHPDEHKAQDQRRRALKQGNGGTFTGAQWKTLRAWFGNCCLRCGAEVKLTADHVIPLTSGGTNGIENIQPLCFSCNSQKHTNHVDYRDPQLLEEFLANLKD